jgi:hypothetical protein
MPMIEPLTASDRGPACDITARDARLQRRFAALCLVWALTYVAATFALEAGRVPPGAGRWLVALAPTAFGLAAVATYVAFVRKADELLQRIHLESLAWGFGVGTVFMMGYRLLERAGAPELDASDPLLVMIVVWAAAQLIITRRYR